MAQKSNKHTEVYKLLLHVNYYGNVYHLTIPHFIMMKFLNKKILIFDKNYLKIQWLLNEACILFCYSSLLSKI